MHDHRRFLQVEPLAEEVGREQQVDALDAPRRSNAPGRRNELPKHRVATHPSARDPGTGGRERRDAGKIGKARAERVNRLGVLAKRDDALAWLNDFGDPYVLSAADNDGRVSIDYGVYGVPETYLIDREGVIRRW